MIEYGLLGERLGHSFSPRLHRLFADYDYRLLPTPRKELETMLKQRTFKGLNVTMPYKQAVMPLLDEIDERAKRIGAVNTIVNRNGRLVGYNTDIDGLLFMARRSGIDLHAKKVLILGSGGTSRTAQAAAQECGASEIVVVSRSGENHYGNLERHLDADVIINTTPVGMYPNCGELPVDPARFSKLNGVLDVVYNPLRTALFLRTQELGIPCSCGLSMLSAQAARAAELFSDTVIEDERIEEVFGELQRELENIVLIGMPGCGKSTIAAEFARTTGREAVEVDEMIVKKAGKSIPAIFSEDGEGYFRRLESECIREVGMRAGIIISTGGGCVTREENYAPLRQNGVLIHLKRELSLLEKEGRPLSQRADISELWEERKDRYAQFADVVVDNNGAPEETLAQIEKELKKR